MPRRKSLLASTSITSDEIAPTSDAEPKKKRTPRPTAPVELKAYTIPQFCEAYNMSIWTYYRIAKAGTGPEVMKIGHKTLIGVSDAEAWQQANKAAAQEQRRAREDA
jgi:hypothetical protein